LTVRGELARVTGLSRPEAGRGNRLLVSEGAAVMHSPGTYALADGMLAHTAAHSDLAGTPVP
jgi:hypothetical protein